MSKKFNQNINNKKYVVEGELDGALYFGEKCVLPHYFRKVIFMTKKTIRDIFKSYRVQVNKEAMELVEQHLKKEVEKMAERCNKGNYKRLNSESFWVALGDWGFESGPRRLTK